MYQPEKPLPYRRCMTAWSHLPSALPPHGTLLAWARGCRCDECEPEYRRFVSELALRGPVRLPAQPEPSKLDADTLRPAGTGGEPDLRAPSAGRCAISGAATWRSPSISAPTHPERRSG